DISIKRPVFATMRMVTLVVLGVVSIRRLAIDEYPDITYPVVSVNTTLAGASPESMMRDVSRPIEEALNTVQGIKEMNSTSQEGSSSVRITFNLGVDISQAQQDVAAKVQRIRRQLPPNVDEPVIQHFDPNESPIMAIGVQSNERALRDLTDLADETIQPRIEAIAGVGGVNESGGRARQIRVQLDPDAMRSYGVSPLQVMNALNAENQDVPAGRVERGANEQLVRITGRVVDPLAFKDIVVSVRNGSPVRLGDVGTVIDGVEDKRSIAEVDGIPTVVLEILKISGANTVEVSDSVQAAMVGLDRQMPSDVKLTLIRDDSKRIRESLTDVETSLALGALLTIAIIYLFLNSWRSTVITGLTLPVSIISAFFIMWVCGFTVNTMTLLALSLAIGLLIDDAIVVRENIVRHVEMGKDHYAAAKEGTDEIGLAVISTTFAVVAVFVPVAFMGGMIGRIFFQFGVTVAFAVLVSLFVSFTLDPMLSSIWYDPEIEGVHGHAGTVPKNLVRRWVLRFNQGFETLADRYPGWLASALDRRWTIVGAASVTVAIAFFLIPRIGFSWMPDTDANEFNVAYKVPPGSRLEYTQDKGREIATFLKSLADVDHVYLSVGGGFQGTPNGGRLTVILRDKSERKRTMQDIQADLRVKLKTIPGVRPSITGQRTVFGGGYRQP
ncbi:MAG TPA: efflux RND transporter permease subunit, partial [Gemmatimonadaceae bacterium]